MSTEDGINCAFHPTGFIAWSLLQKEAALAGLIQIDVDAVKRRTHLKDAGNNGQNGVHEALL